jgi:hypothetical protein
MKYGGMTLPAFTLDDLFNDLSRMTQEERQASRVMIGVREGLIIAHSFHLEKSPARETPIRVIDTVAARVAR